MKICNLLMYIFPIIQEILQPYGYFIRLSCHSSVNFNTVRIDSILRDSVIKEISFLELNECKAECLLNRDCRSINYQIHGDNICQLNNRTTTNMMDADHFVKRSGWDFMTSDSEAHQSSLIGNTCNKNHPCPNDFICIDQCSCPGFHCLQAKLWEDCDGLLSNGVSSSGVYFIKPNAVQPSVFPVFCNFDTANQGWIVIQRRVDGTTSFDRLWDEYKKGFGDLRGNYWIGLDKLNLLAGPDRGAMLRVDLRLTDNTSLLLHARYNLFIVENESMNYRLTVNQYEERSTLRDYFSNSKVGSFAHSGQMFSTKDKDNDENSFKNCALSMIGGWWFSSCGSVYLNGLFASKTSLEDCLNDPMDDKYMHWLGTTNCEKKVIWAEMKIRYGSS